MTRKVRETTDLSMSEMGWERPTVREGIKEIDLPVTGDLKDGDVLKYSQRRG